MLVMDVDEAEPSREEVVEILRAGFTIAATMRKKIVLMTGQDRGACLNDFKFRKWW